MLRVIWIYGEDLGPAERSLTHGPETNVVQTGIGVGDGRRAGAHSGDLDEADVPAGTHHFLIHHGIGRRSRNERMVNELERGARARHSSPRAAAVGSEIELVGRRAWCAPLDVDSLVDHERVAAPTWWVIPVGYGREVGSRLEIAAAATGHKGDGLAGIGGTIVQGLNVEAFPVHKVWPSCPVVARGPQIIVLRAEVKIGVARVHFAIHFIDLKGMVAA